MNLAEVLAVVGDLSEPSDIADNGAHHGYRRAVIVNRGAWYVPALADILAPFDPVRECWLSWIEPGGYIVEHVDGGPYFERWQIPFTAEGTLHADGDAVAHEVGVAFRVHQYEWHHVTNETNVPRVSLVIDRDIPLDVPSAPFQVKENP